MCNDGKFIFKDFKFLKNFQNIEFYLIIFINNPIFYNFPSELIFKLC